MKKVIVTTSWDDGHKLDVRLSELLKKYNIQGTFYVAPKNHELLASNTLNDHQIKEISSSFEIGAHTIIHKALTGLPDNVAFSEIKDSKKYLEKVTGKVVNSFCYPLGKYKAKHAKMVEDAGFTYARTVSRHSTGSNGMPFEAETSVHTYNHWSDLWEIFSFSGFNPVKTIKYFQWDNLAKEMFDRTLENGGVFHLWGHSWEIDKHNDWNKLEDVLKYISNKSGVEYVCNGELSGIRFDKKVVIVAPYFLPHMGGVEFYIYNIAHKLQSEFGWDVCIVTTGDKGTKTTVEYFEGMKVYRLGYWFKLSNAPINLLWPFILRNIFRVEHADLINVHAPVPGLPDIGAWVSGATPVVVTYHAGSMKKGKIIPDIVIWLYENGPLKWLLNMADSIVCSSDFVRDDFLNKYKYKSKTITPGVDTAQFKPAENSVINSNTILFVAGLSRSQQFKGLKLLMEAIKKVSENIPTIRLVVVGEGDMRTEYEEHSKKLGLEKNVSFMGKLTGEPLVHAYQQASVFVLPSSSPAESFGMVLVEAMACGRPVIGTNLGGIPNVIDNEKNGILIPEKNVKALSSAIERVLSDKNLADTFGKNGLEKALSKFDWETRVHEYNNLFKSYLIKRI